MPMSASVYQVGMSVWVTLLILLVSVGIAKSYPHQAREQPCPQASELISTIQLT